MRGGGRSPRTLGGCDASVVLHAHCMSFCGSCDVSDVCTADGTTDVQGVSIEKRPSLKNPMITKNYGEPSQRALQSSSPSLSASPDQTALSTTDHNESRSLKVSKAQSLISNKDSKISTEKSAR